LALLRFANLPFLPLQTDADPHNATCGFFSAHVGWLLFKKHPDIVAVGKKLTFDDLANDSTVTFQKATDPWFALFMCFVFPGLVSPCGETASGTATGWRAV
jgi:stearoyl-CoA desaturase (delta-9 desaturase)